MINKVAPTLLNSPLAIAVAEINARLDTLEAHPKLKAIERHKEYYANSSIHGGNILKEHALLICASVDENTAEYQTLVAPLIERIETFFTQPGHPLDFDSVVRMLRARRLIEHGKYTQADHVYAQIPYSPIYATAFEQRNRYFLNAGKNHLHLIKKLSRPHHVNHQLLQALEAFYYVRAYPHADDINLYQNAAAIFSQNYYEEAKMQVSKICEQLLPDSLKHMNQQEIIVVYKALFPYKQTLNHEVSSLQNLRHATPWYGLVKTMQKQFIAMMFDAQVFHHPDKSLMRDAHALLNEPTSTLSQLQHLVGNTHLDKNFLAAMMGNANAMTQLRQFR